MDQIFNELSANCYEDKHTASTGMEKLGRISKALSDLGYSSYLLTTAGFGQLSLSPNYTIHQWLVDKRIGAERDVQRWLLTAATGTSYIENLIEGYQSDCALEFRHLGERCQGLGLASLQQDAALSLDGDAAFLKPWVSINVLKLTDVGEDEKIVEVKSIYSEDQIDEISEETLKDRIINLSNGTELIRDSENLFPHLSFTKNAEQQLLELTGSEPYFSRIIDHLSILNETMSKWEHGQFEPKGFDWSIESEATLNQYSKSREFACRDGGTRTFSCHSKMRGANQRIHFFPEPEERLVHIGYVGQHLPTAESST